MPYVTVNSHRIHYVDTQGLDHHTIDAHKLPIIMIHGLGSSQNYYLPIFPELAGHRCIALTTYGAAESKSKGEHLTLDQLGEDVVGVMDSLAIRQAVVVGHSMGGSMCCTIAAAHPERVAGIVCIGPVHPSTVKSDVFQSRIDTVLKDGMEPLANTIPQAATNVRSTALQRAMIRELLTGQEPPAYASHCRVIMEMRAPDLASIQAPALILAGEEDRSAPLEGCQYILQHLGSRQKRIEVLPGVGHWHCIEAGDRVGKVVAAFAAQLAA